MPLAASTQTLSGLLQRVFGHSEFRPHQREVCEAAASGRDVLLVMPTGAGKSLCYQLPALARSGTALVISPLIALMEDQSTRLAALGLEVARIHSGLTRESSREACRDYLAGALDFLFIAPERMRVPGFPEMLGRRKPSLIAIDEAHCISQWGHDFRPDYRTLGQHLPALRPASIVALTATATPTVQKDIAHQLQLNDPAVFITGFRRDNLAIEVAEMSKPQRGAFTARLLADPSARPAIVYAPSRKAADELAALLNRDFPTRAYHAGLDGGTRERVQRDFLSGNLEAVVATIAFGMGVDKADVRTVVHVALPGSVEAYYQEIGRAGRDGLPSRTVLLHSFADRRLQEFFLERSYPPAVDLERVQAALTEDFEPVEELARSLKMDVESLERILDKLLGHGVAATDATGTAVRRAEERAWRPGYDAQVAFRRREIDRMVAFAEGQNCRMNALVEHFGDLADRRQPCGLCDVCNPAGTSGTASHQASAEERKALRCILGHLQSRSTSTGKLFEVVSRDRDVSASLRNREVFDALLDALTRAGLATVTKDSFRGEEGKDITYRKVGITHEGREPDDATLDTVWIRGVDDQESGRTSRGRSGSSRSKSDASDRDSSRTKTGAAAKPPASLSPAAEAIFHRLRAWRTQTAQPTRTPTFMILSDAVLRSVALAAPRDLTDLRAVPGIGPAKVERYGAEILAAIREEPVAGASVPSAKVAPRVQAADVASTRRDASAAPDPSRAKRRPTGAVAPASPLDEGQQALAERLRAWRREEASRAGLPTFFVFSDTVLQRLAQASPQSLAELGQVRGLETGKLDRFGPALLAVCRSAHAAAAALPSALA